MFPRPFDYFSPKNFDEALELLKDGDVDTRILSGGQSLLPAMKARNLCPKILVDIGRIKELNFIRKEENNLKIGATTTTGTLEVDSEVASLLPILNETALEIADPLVRNLGTVGGNLCYADPVNDLAAPMLVLNSSFEVASKQRTRTIKSNEFFLDKFKTALKPNEVLTQIQIPIDEGRVGSAYRKVKKGSGGFTIAGAAAYVSVAEDKTVLDCRLAMTAVGPKAFRAQKAEEALIGKKPEAEKLKMQQCWLLRQQNQLQTLQRQRSIDAKC